MQDRAAPDDSAPRDGAAERADAVAAHALVRYLHDAELLLRHAVDSGLVVPIEVSQAVLDARATPPATWPPHVALNLLDAVSKLAALVKPVSAESLRLCGEFLGRPWWRRVRRSAMTVLLAIIVIGYSTMAFLMAAYSEKIRTNLDIANPLAVKLVDELGYSASLDPALCPPGALKSASLPPEGITDFSKLPKEIHRKDVIDDLQKFAQAIRDMYAAALQVQRLYGLLEVMDRLKNLGRSQALPWTGQEARTLGYPAQPAIPTFELFELPPGLPDPAKAANERICVYQHVRYFAQTTEVSATIVIGAAANCALPALYALLGAAAYMTRRLERQLKTKTFTGEAYSTRLITAAIAGAVVGLFNFGQSLSVSPLAIAFLVGYAVDIFFTFLEHLIRNLGRVPNGEVPDPPAPPP